MENDEQRSTCANKHILSGDLRHARVFYGTFFAFAFLIPLVAVSVLYGAMVRRLLRKSGAVGGARRADGKQAESTRAKRRVTRLVVIVVVTFAACWLPMQVRVQMQPFTCSKNPICNYFLRLLKGFSATTLHKLNRLGHSSEYQ